MRRQLRSVVPARPYVYDSVATAELEPKRFRLLRLDGEDHGTMRGHLHTTELDNAPPYYALSYSWGRGGRNASISCDGLKLRVTASLVQALRRVYDFSNETADIAPTTKWFWIDQICVNQEDTDERSAQVALMRDIYSRAIKTLIWLGPVDGSCHLGWTLFDQIYEVFREENPDATYLSDIKFRLYSRSYHATCGLPDFESNLWEHLRKILQASWFRRVWVIQEVALSRQDPTILHGDHQYPWHKLGWASTWLRRSGFCRLDHIPSQMLNVDTIANLRRTRIRWKLPAMLMATSGKFLATDPRDKIFGLLGLALETEHQSCDALQADYRRSTAQVYRELAKFLINEYQSLAILDRTIPYLNRFGWVPKSNSMPILESWVPSWSVLTEPSQPRYLSWATYHAGGGGADLGFPPHYKAAAGLPTSIVSMVGADERVLHIRGLNADTVSSSSGFGDGLKMLLQDPNTPHRTLKDLRLLSKSDGRALPTKLVLMLISVIQKPLFLRYWHLALAKSKGLCPEDLINAFIKCTTVDQFGLAGVNSEQVQKDGCAYLLQQLQHEQQRGRHFWGASSSHPAHVETSSHSNSESLTCGNGTSLEREAHYLKVLRLNATGGKPEAYLALARNYCLNRRFFITSSGRLGVGPRWTRKGDLVCVLLGGGVPYVLSPKGKYHTFIGESYVHGLMEGQAVESWRKGELKDEIFGLL